MGRATGISLGDFNLRVTFYQQSKGAVDEYGNPTLSLGSAIQRWANVHYKSGSYNDVNSGIEYHEWFEIYVRKPLSIGVGDRVDFDGDQLTIVGVNDVDLVQLKIKAIR